MKYSRYLLLIMAYSFFAGNTRADDVLVEKDTIVMTYTAKEVVIESFKQNDNLSTLPISATLLSNQTIKDRNIISINEVSAFVPNLFIPDYGSKMITPAYIRGIGSRINAPSVGLYVDGVPYFDRSSFDIDLNDVERIEVLRGPQGTIYGRNTMGGIINIYTKSPLKYKETNVNLGAANYNTYQGGISNYGKLSKNLGYSVSGNYFHTGGFFDNKYTGKKADAMDAISTRIRLSWRIKPRLNVQFISAYEYSDQDGYPYRVYNSETSEMMPVNYNAPSYYRRNMSSNGVNVEYTADHFKIGSQSSFQYFDGKQGLDQDFSPEDIYYVDFTQRQHMYSQEFNIKSIGNDKYVWQFGAFGFYQNYKTTNDVDYRMQKRQTLQNARNPITGVALYHQSTINDLLTKGLSLGMGLRYDWEETKTTVNNKAITQGADPTFSPEVNESSVFSQVTPKASLQYAFASDNLIYFSVAKGYKTGGFNATIERDEDRTFKPEHSWSYELGTKANCFNKLIYTDISLFYIIWNDQQISQTQPSGKGYLLRNAGKSVSKGVEVTTHINPVENLSIQLSYGYTHAKFNRYEVNATLNYNGNYLPMVPQNTFSTSADYTVKLKDTYLDKILISGQYAGVGKIYWNEDNKVVQPFYGMLNGKVSFVKDKFSLDVWAKNIAGKEYIAYYFKTGTSEYVQAGKPFTFGVNLHLNF
ncbi:TonB-dependent receptor [Dysgonomonas sp. ZJ709]|uniref:TonB-dependent receptor n=1 Tax=Dysgonomonas sp. ZJ709 TaxID=2709797 RepID=UPI0013ECCFDF|nr:TonB-dependent receptor [Dysgonomonas sp. ZJ709]